VTSFSGSRLTNPEDEGTVIYGNIRSNSASTGVTSQYTCVFESQSPCHSFSLRLVYYEISINVCICNVHVLIIKALNMKFALNLVP
jgi:hypothetical protein